MYILFYRSAKKKIKNCSQIHNKNSNKTVFKIKKCRVLLNKVSVSHQAEHPLEHTVTSNSNFFLRYFFVVVLTKSILFNRLFGHNSL